MATWLEQLIGGGAKGLMEGAGTLAKDIRVAITGIDPVKQAEIEAKLVEMENAAMLAQTQINLVEAASSSKFVSWWRPAVGWCCVLALMMNYLGLPIAQWVVSLSGSTVSLFKVELAELYPLLIGILGLGGLRSWEKLKGVQGNH
jgi:hypothetical protein